MSKNEVNIFEWATRRRLRFVTEKGTCSVEDLWRMPLEQLDNVAKGLKRSLDTDISYITQQSKECKKTQLKLDVTVHIINQLLREKEDAHQAQLVGEERQRLIDILADKKDQVLRELSVEDLQKRIEELK